MTRHSRCCLSLSYPATYARRLRMSLVPLGTPTAQFSPARGARNAEEDAPMVPVVVRMAGAEGPTAVVDDEAAETEIACCCSFFSDRERKSADETEPITRPDARQAPEMRIRDGIARG